MTKVKICGITNLEDAKLSAKFGADALGFNFYEKSPRYILPEKAREIIEQLPENTLKVGVFVNESLEKIIEIAEIAKLDALQLHGEETPEFARELKQKTNLEIIKAFRVSPEFKPEDVLQYEVDAILLDAYNPKEHGGTGETFDWKIAKKVQEIFSKMYLAGGLSQENIASAILEVKPFAVDACSCLEKEKGKKEKVYLINFLKAAKFHQNIPENENDIFSLLSIFQPRPAMYIGKLSMTSLRTYLAGFDMGIKFGKSEFDWKDFWLEFPRFISNRFEKSSRFDWAGIILEECNDDEKKALYLFFALLEEFKLEKEDLGDE